MKKIFIPDKPKLNHPILFFTSNDDHRSIKKLARLYAKGNVSHWIRYAALHYKPREAVK